MNSLKLMPALFASLLLAACGVDQATIDNGGSDATYEVNNNATRAMTSVAAVVRQTGDQGLALTGDAKFEVIHGLDSKYYFHVRAGNGEIVLQSQSYSSRTSAVNGAISVQGNGADATKYTVL